jgi:hypothetical protein
VLFRGTAAEAPTECLLVYDEAAQSYVLERLTTKYDLSVVRVADRPSQPPAGVILGSSGAIAETASSGGSSTPGSPSAPTTTDDSGSMASADDVGKSDEAAAEDVDEDVDEDEDEDEDDAPVVRTGAATRRRRQRQGVPPPRLVGGESTPSTPGSTDTEPRSDASAGSQGGRGRGRGRGRGGGRPRGSTAARGRGLSRARTTGTLPRMRPFSAADARALAAYLDATITSDAAPH